MSGILWEEMLKQSMARSRGEVKRMVQAKQIQLQNDSGFHLIADFDDLELPAAAPKIREIRKCAAGVKFPSQNPKMQKGVCI